MCDLRMKPILAILISPGNQNYEMLPVENFHFPAPGKHLKYGTNPPTRKFC